MTDFFSAPLLKPEMEPRSALRPACGGIAPPPGGARGGGGGIPPDGAIGGGGGIRPLDIGGGGGGGAGVEAAVINK